MKRYVYVIPAIASDGVVHRYIGQTAHVTKRMSWHRHRHENGKHKNIPAHFTVNWLSVLVLGPITGTAEEIAKGEEQKLYEYWLARGPVLNKMAPRLTTADALIASCGIGGKQNIWKARAALTPEGLAAGRKKSGQITGAKHAASGHMSAVGRAWGPIQGRRNAEAGLWKQTLGKLTKEQMRQNGKTGGAYSGRLAAESGRLASYNAARTPEERQALAAKAGKVRAKMTNARRWGVEVAPGLWHSRKTGDVLLDLRGVA